MRPNQMVLTRRAWLVLHIAGRTYWPLDWRERKRFIRRALFVKWLIATGRLHEPTS